MTAALDTLDVMEIMKRIPHRYPMLLVDRLIDIVKNESAIGIKNVTINEGFFQGHFPERPVMPGVLIVEAMAQTAGTLVVYSMGGEADGKLVYFMSIEEAKFRKPIGPGDQIKIHVNKEQARRNVWRFKGKAMVDDVLCAEATFTAMIMDNSGAS
ncbi:MAG TPA: 3-hydroxyacyl-ACP dehydratase FabZ [Alphaproteobacteria bacterium]|nr:3-hydroxyacyl-[acyl-carrier-protein] dehydratase FabZ [Rhodospirillaceae bacterium]HRJ12217.1 3-hydroxyacyl-ACP dehydratase FabZ [Alphaproteobacteria bacterium]